MHCTFITPGHSFHLIELTPKLRNYCCLGGHCGLLCNSSCLTCLLVTVLGVVLSQCAMTPLWGSVLSLCAMIAVFLIITTLRFRLRGARLEGAYGDPLPGPADTRQPRDTSHVTRTRAMSWAGHVTPPSATCPHTRTGDWPGPLPRHHCR